MEEKNKHRSARGNIKPSHKKSRDWSITAWEEPKYDILQMKYLIYGEEFCPETQKKHWQTYVYFFNAKTFDQVTKYFLKGKNRVELSKGDAKENIAYCSKDGNFKEFGERPSQGKRTDLIKICDSIKEGKKVDDIALENPEIYHQYGRTLNKIEDLVMRKNHRKNITKGMWIYGSTGTGKSTKAYENYDESTHFDLINDRGWWDGYHQQENVIINDFRGWIDYDMLLKIVDWTPLKVPRRGREPMPFTSKFVYITSSLHPKDVYCNRHDRDSIEQLYRRFRIVKIEKCYETIEHEPTDERFHWG